MKTSEYLFSKRTGFFHIIARYIDQTSSFSLLVNRVNKHLGHPQKHIFGGNPGGRIRGSKHLNFEAAWEISKFGNLFEPLHVAFYFI